MIHVRSTYEPGLCTQEVPRYPSRTQRQSTYISQMMLLRLSSLPPEVLIQILKQLVLSSYDLSSPLVAGKEEDV